MVEDNTLQVHVASLRRVLGEPALATVSGRGFRCKMRGAGPAPALLDPTAELVGREALLDQVQAILARDDVHLLTLTGPGGLSKMHLALQPAARHAPQRSDGTYTVTLAAVRDATQVLAHHVGLVDGAVPQGLRDRQRRSEGVSAVQR